MDHFQMDPCCNLKKRKHTCFNNLSICNAWILKKHQKGPKGSYIPQIGLYFDIKVIDFFWCFEMKPLTIVFVDVTMQT